MKKAFDIASVSIFVFLMFLITAFPSDIAQLTKRGIKMCFNGAIPSIFVLMILTQFFTRTGITESVGILFSPIIKPVFGVRKELCGAFFSGTISGFPNGVHSVGLIYKKGKCTKNEAEYCLALSNNCSLPFFTAVIGAKVFNNVMFGFIIAFSNILCIIIDSVVLRFFYKKSSNDYRYIHNNSLSGNTISISDAICQSITSSCTSAVFITGFITFFYVVSCLLSKALKLSSTGNCLLAGCFELFSGVMSINVTNIYKKIVLCSAMTGFSGLSVIFQVTEAAQRYGLSVKKFICTRIINMFLMPSTALFITKLIYNEPFATTFNINCHYSQTSGNSVFGTVIVYGAIITVAMLFILVLYLFSVAAEDENSRIMQDKA